jgi:acetyl-CoA carboxylase alpha subunit
MSLNLISPDQSNYLHSIANNIIPEAKALYSVISPEDQAATVAFNSHIKQRLRALNLSSTDQSLVLSAIEAGLTPIIESNPEDFEVATES